MLVKGSPCITFFCFFFKSDSNKSLTNSVCVGGGAMKYLYLCDFINERPLIISLHT